jgi:diguanylate cyclase (GGDEF)-like protein/PAS domain S-box-containing protein
MGYGYKLGDLGGLMSIKLPASIIEERVNKQLLNDALTHFISLLVTFVLLSWLLQGAVVSRISLLKEAAVRMMKGDYSKQAELPGNDEVSQVSIAFDEMAREIEKRERALEVQKSLYSALSWTSKSITRLDSQKALFEETCHIAVEYGGMDQACIALLDDTGENLIVIEGTGYNVRNISFPLDQNYQYETAPIVTAVKEGRSIVTNDARSEYPAKQWQNMLAQNAMQSAALFPLKQERNPIGVFCVFSREKGFFSDDVIGLLDEMASEISYAVHNYHLASEHKKTHKRLEESSFEMRRLNSQLRLLLESTGEGIFGINVNGNCTFINQSALDMFGFSREEIIGKSIHELTHHSHADGTQYPIESCPMHQAYRTGAPCRVQKEVFWRQDGTSFPVEYSAYPIIEEGEVLGSVAVFRDVTDSHAMEQRLSFLATHDPLTRLLNRYAFEQRLKKALEDAHVNDTNHVLCYMDLDQFKVVNDTCGHVAGDAMLQMIAKLLQNNLRHSDTLARLGGDEFGLLLEECSLKEAEALTTKICEAVKEFRFSWDDKTFSTGVSVGIAAITSDTTNVDLVMSAADSACYIAKDMGRNRVHIHLADDEEVAKRQGEMRWVTEIQSAMEDGRLSLYRQSIMPLSKKEQEKDHFEILLRMKDKEGRDVPPGAFIPAAERFAMMPMLDRWVIQSTLAWLANADNRGRRLGICSINISGHSLADDGLKDFILDQLRRHNIPAEKICFEITETAAVSRLDQAIHFIGEMRELGCRFALDDFGTGMSSFAYLKNLPVDFLKIDGSFVRDILDDPVDCGMVESINQIGHLMGLKTIAEYVESYDVRERLADIGVDYVQGFGVSAPEPLD